ncbi:hypothetical protein HMPREF1986_01205 [Oribacterium sp. oral taxon 078 str. F0263]|nr:hypothetical protein HMPREF1986_01205 [Oribacterium sp. oral taxon 078 str. F0263]
METCSRSSSLHTKKGGAVSWRMSFIFYCMVLCWSMNKEAAL